MIEDDSVEPGLELAVSAVPEGPRPGTSLRGPVLGLALGVMILTALALVASHDSSQQPWSHAVLSVAGKPLWKGTRPIYVRDLPQENWTWLDRVLARYVDNPRIRAALPSKPFPLYEEIIGVKLSPKTWAGLLASGRVPRAGAREAVAGYVAQSDSFVMDGARFQVVGRLRRGVAGLADAYIVPLDGQAMRYFGPNTGATRGWLDPNGLTHLRVGKLSRMKLTKLRLLGGAGSNAPWLSICTVLTLAMMAAAGSVGHIRIFRRLAADRRRMLSPIFEAMSAWPRLFAGLHVFLYGCVMVFMGLALVFPRVNFLMTALLEWVFSKGGLGYVGNAYESGNILRAAWATFQHNYVAATVLAAILPSLIVPFSGLLLNTVRFCVVGLGMAPILVGSIAHFSYHSITMVLELEAYIVASFLIVLWPVYVVRGAALENTLGEWWKGVNVVISGTVLVGIMLAIAALYEATTITLLQ